MTAWRQETEWIWCPKRSSWYALFRDLSGGLITRCSPPRECWRPRNSPEPIKLTCQLPGPGSLVASCTGDDQIAITHSVTVHAVDSISTDRVLSVEDARRLRDWLTAAIERMEDGQ